MRATDFIQQGKINEAGTGTMSRVAIKKNYPVTLDMIKNKEMQEGLRDPQDNPCWKGYHAVGTKKKNGRTVPNCVPRK